MNCPCYPPSGCHYGEDFDELPDEDPLMDYKIIAVKSCFPYSACPK